MAMTHIGAAIDLAMGQINKELTRNHNTMTQTNQKSAPIGQIDGIGIQIIPTYQKTIKTNPRALQRLEPINQLPMIAIDPGTTQSAYVVFDGQQVIKCGIDDNENVRKAIQYQGESYQLAVEMVACYGMPVGKEVFETCLWVGRFIEAFEGQHRLVYRKDVKLWLCGSMRAKDGNIRQALIDKYGAPGTKKEPGGTYGVKSHIWAALAVADYAWGNR